MNSSYNQIHCHRAEVPKTGGSTSYWGPRVNAKGGRTIPKCKQCSSENISEA